MKLSIWISSFLVRVTTLLRALTFLSLLQVFLVGPVGALSELPIEITIESFGSNFPSVLLPSIFSQLQEVQPPGAVRQVKDRLEKYDPRLVLESPKPEAIINDDWEIVLRLEDWPLVNDSDVGLGPHVVVQLDNNSPLRVTDIEDSRLHIPMDALSPGSHRISSYIAYPWGEALKVSGTSLQFRIHSYQKLIGTQPDQDDPWLLIVSPSEAMQLEEPLLLDWIIWNAPLQGLTEGDDRWRLRISINEQNFLIDGQEPVWIKGLPESPAVMRFQLIDALGKPIEPVFNNQLRVLKSKNSESPIWMQSALSENELLSLLGESLSLESSLKLSSLSDTLETSELNEAGKNNPSLIDISKDLIAFPKGDSLASDELESTSSNPFYDDSSLQK